MAKYLDDNGLLYLWNKFKTTFAKVSDIPTDNAALANGAGYQTFNDVNNTIIEKGYTTMGAVESKGYQTAPQVTSAISTALADITGIEFAIVDDLPTVGSAGTIYLVLKATTATGNIYTEYIYVNNKFETLGDTTVDLSGYLQKTDIAAINNSEIDTIIGG